MGMGRHILPIQIFVKYYFKKTFSADQLILMSLKSVLLLLLSCVFNETPHVV